jgi:hypothetical protein
MPSQLPDLFGVPTATSGCSRTRRSSDSTAEECHKPDLEANKVPFIAAVQTTEDGKPVLACFAQGPFTNS